MWVRDFALKSFAGCTVESRIRSLPIMVAGPTLRRPVESENRTTLSSVYGSYNGRCTCHVRVLHQQHPAQNQAYKHT